MYKTEVFKIKEGMMYSNYSNIYKASPLLAAIATIQLEDNRPALCSSRKHSKFGTLWPQQPTKSLNRSSLTSVSGGHRGSAALDIV